MAAMHVNIQSLAQKHKNNHPKIIVPYTNRPSFKLQIHATVGGPGRQLIESGTIRATNTKEAAMVLKSEGFKLLDVRPEWERKKARVPGSLHVSLFIEDVDNSPITLLKKWVHFGYIGLWTGQKFTAINPKFICQVQVVVPEKDTMLLVACGEGLRSVMAVSKLYEAGYRKLGWLAGGFNRVKDGDFPVDGAEKLQYSTIGGVSYYFLKLLKLLQAEGISS